MSTNTNKTDDEIKDGEHLSSVRIPSGFWLPVIGLLASLMLAIICSIIGIAFPQYVNEVLRIQLILLFFAFPFTTLLLIRLRQNVTIPLKRLRQWSRQIRAGDLYTPIPLPPRGRLRQVISDINTLTDELHGLTDEMDTKVRAQTEHIASKSRSLEILYDIATDLSTARNLDELLEQFLDTLMVLVDARAASVRLKTDGGQTQLVASRGLTTEIVQQELRVDLDRCLCGDIAQHGGLGIQQGLASCDRYLDCGKMLDDCSELIVVPLQYRDNILGVYNLFLDRPSAELGKGVRDLLNSIGKHLGLAIEKAHLDDNERRLAIMEERNMIGNELHDSLAQTIVSMRLQIKVLGELLHKKDTRGAQDEVRRLRSAIEEAHDSLRELLTNFKTRMDERGLIPSIEDLVVRFRSDTGVTVFLQNEWDQTSFSPTQEVQVFRIIQEALANIRKHSNASNVRIMLHHSDSKHFNVLIEDDGHGINQDKDSPSRPGEQIGLRIMRERATRLNGSLIIESEPGEGTHVHLSCPISLSEKPTIQTKVTTHARTAN
ncbi:MAG: GAF domain-containing protein [Proteobacteria bacterium]|nr:GAF domain-containing protein [Pseudomonadota bacterium]